MPTTHCIAANTAGSTQTNTPRLTVTTGLTPGTLDDGQTRKIAAFTIFCKGSRQRRRGMGCSRTTQSTCKLWLFSNSSNNIVARKKNKSPGTQKWKILCFVSFSIVNFDPFSEKKYGVWGVGRICWAEKDPRVFWGWRGSPRGEKHI